MSKVKATFNGFVGHNGVPVELHEGEEWDAEHPLVKDRPELFTAPASQPAKPTPAKPTPAKAAPAKPAPARPQAPKGKPKASDG